MFSFDITFWYCTFKIEVFCVKNDVFVNFVDFTLHNNLAKYHIKITN